MESKPVILIDDDCVFCNRTVDFIIRRGGDEEFRFLSLYSDEGKKLLEEHGLPEDYTNSVVLIENSMVYLKSEAVLEIAGRLKGVIKMLKWTRFVPLRIRDTIYDITAKHRHKLI